MLYESQYYGITSLGDTLMHHGIKGQKHGVRRWQNHDGSLTPEGYIHYGVGHGRNKAKTDKDSGPRTLKEIRKDTKIVDKYADSGPLVPIKLKDEADAAAKRLGYKDVDDYTAKNYHEEWDGYAPAWVKKKQKFKNLSLEAAKRLTSINSMSDLDILMKAYKLPEKRWEEVMDEARKMVDANKELDKRSDNEVSEVEKNEIRAKTTNEQKPLTKYNPKLKGQEKADNINGIVYDVGKALIKGASKEDIVKQLKDIGVPPASRNLIISTFERKGSFDKKVDPKNQEAALKQLHERFNKLLGEDYTVGSGAELQRFTTNGHEMPDAERKYVSLTDKDKRIYKNFYATDLAGFQNYNKTGGYGYSKADFNYLRPHVYETTLSNIKEMKVAGAKTYSDTFMELYNNPDIRKQAGWEKTEKGKLYTAIFGKSLRELQARQANAARDSFDLNLQERESENTINKAFLNKLREKGYDAVEDQFSKKVDGTEGNLIVLNPNQSLKKTSNRAVKFDDALRYAGTESIEERDQREKANERARTAMEKQVVSALNAADNQNKTKAEVSRELADKYGVSLSTISYIYRKEKAS